ncbi:phage holin family protein [Streptomyces sp. TLI_105]|uniref:phage holin family protein n=1 Tax=Streptomyces sp. TLI_105 TaxID=1881019 RepID=UPI0008973AA2|nr:phage holin family protein [Streptomyces sp. TLI_105]SED27611.1 4 TMS phage holin, superfamily IV [Streptomyces sp. TLI_105]
MNDQGRRRLGVLIGVGLACGLLPGIALGGTETVDAVLAVLMAALVMTILTQLISIGPSGRVPLPALLVFGLAGFVQDALIWWLLSWLGPKIGYLHIEGLATILLAALITRATTLLLSQLSPAAETAED